MAFRTGMANLVQRLRAKAIVAEDTFTVDGVDMFDDSTLQDTLDRYRIDVYREPLTNEIIYDGVTARYYDYYWQQPDAEEATSGSAIWQVQNAAGSAIGTALYTPNYPARHIRFAADQAGTAYYLSYRAFDFKRAAADVWEMKAGFYAEQFDVATDGHDLKRSQKIKHCLTMAQTLRTSAGARQSQLDRSDAW